MFVFQRVTFQLYIACVVTTTAADTVATVAAKARFRHGPSTRLVESGNRA